MRGTGSEAGETAQAGTLHHLIGDQICLIKMFFEGQRGTGCDRNEKEWKQQQCTECPGWYKGSMERPRGVETQTAGYSMWKNWMGLSGGKAYEEK